MNSLCNIAAYWWDGGGEVEEAAYELTPQPPDALLRLRAQCESLAKQQQVRTPGPIPTPRHAGRCDVTHATLMPPSYRQLYAKKPANWLDWDKVSGAAAALPKHAPWRALMSAG